jgi:DNA-binding NtrC family response regulator
MRALTGDLVRYARADANVLIVGETGSGKDFIARTLHDLGPRRHHPFVVVDCPGLAATLLESELFGHDKGAFTDATQARAGRFEAAGAGTVYLDRVDELPFESQGKLLRIVEQKHIERLGSGVSIPIAARVIASAGENIELAVREGRFRADLFHRLRVLPLRVPALRDRRGDLAALARRLLRDAVGNRRPPSIDADALTALEQHHWPGNARELRHVLERAAVVDDDQVIGVGDLPTDLMSPDPAADEPPRGRPTLEELERRYVAFVLQDTRGNQTRAAEILGISRKALWEKRRRYGLN